MKKYLLLAFLILSVSVIKSQDYKILKTKIGINYDKLKINKLHEIDSNIFVSIKQNNSKKYKLIYTWEVWCKPCIKSLPKVIDFVNENKEIMDLFIVMNENEQKWLKKTFKYFNKKGYPNYPLFVLNDRRKNYLINYEKFVGSFFPEHNKSKEYGLSLLMLFSNLNNPIYASTYNEDTLESLDIIKRNIQPDIK